MKKINLPKIFKALASEKRLTILKVLLKSKQGLYPTLLSTKLNIPVETIERHLLKLRNIKVVNSKRYKNKMVYKIVIPNSVIKKLLLLLQKYF
ncbi:MAG: hypothetical protein AB1349_09920 [Elusimicrobiota bacterium]